ncbi:MAG: hypothetical protein INQ03_21270 [Candidatus Heimdallarchaeota archaeon]|nr:hypothetical protein [Candidatus Heimdallarchaeota archaeon]
MKTEELNKSLEYAIQVNEKARLLKNETLIAHSFRLLGRINQFLGNFDDSMEMYNQALQVSENSQVRSIIALDFIPLLIKLDHLQQSQELIEELYNLSINNPDINMKLRYIISRIQYNLHFDKINTDEIGQLLQILTNVSNEFKKIWIITLMKIDLKILNSEISNYIVNNISILDNHYLKMVYLIARGLKIEDRKLEKLRENEIENLFKLDKASQKEKISFGIRLLDEFMVLKSYQIIEIQ